MKREDADKGQRTSSAQSHRISSFLRALRVLRGESMKMLQARGLAKRFGARRVFGPLDFDLESGKAIAIVGRNGAGKSTLLKIVAGLERASRGEIVWRDANIKSENSLSELRTLCGLSAPDAPHPRELSVLENLDFVSNVRGLELSRDELLSHLESCGLSGREHDLAGELSSGLRTRLSLSIAILHAPPILLLDEPGANLDDSGRELLHRVLDVQRTRGIALVATNDAREADLCDERIEL